MPENPDQDTILNNPEDPEPVKETDQPADQPEENNEEGPDTILAQIKREDGTQKYSDVPTALEALKESQNFIGQLQTENQQLKEELEQYKEQANKNIAMEDILNTLNQNKDTDEQPSGESLVSPAQIQEYVNQAITQREAKQTAEYNQKQVAEALVEQYGDREKANEFYKQRAQELGVSVDFLNDAAGKSPQAAKQLLGLSENKQTESQPLESTVNTEAHQGDPNTRKKPEKSMLAGATDKEVAAEMRRIRQEIESQYQ